MFAAVVFIAGVAAVAILLARTPTVASGRVMEAELLAQTRDQGVVGMQCDPVIPIGRRGAQFGCVAVLGGGGMQQLACVLDRDARLTWKPVSGVVRNGIVAPEDPQGQRP